MTDPDDLPLIEFPYWPADEEPAENAAAFAAAEAHRRLYCI